jgi:Glycosyltransferases involved in cell wall biogenesis
MYNFLEISLLITHYNRSKSLENLLSSFEKLNCKFGEIVISDDGSMAEHLDYIRDVLSKKYEFNLVTTSQNKGLGNNINKGQDVVKMPYTLYIQEDFEPLPAFPKVLDDAQKIIKEDPTFDIIKFYAYYTYPYTKPYKCGFQETVFKKEIWCTNNLKFYFYGDHPHLRHSNFMNKFGRFKEGIHSDRAEFLMGLSFIKNNARGLIYDRIHDLFLQKNSSNEPSMVQRKEWRQGRNVLVLFLRRIYLTFKLIRTHYELIRLK